MTKFNIYRLNDQILAIGTKDNSYLLNYCHEEGFPSCLFSFTGNLPDFKGCSITNRDYPYEYPFKLTQMLLNNPGQVVDVGAGLGEFVPKLAAQNPECKPIVIDPVNYDLMAEMLEFARPYVGLWHLPRLNELSSRCATILDSSKVTLYNTFLSEALKNNPQLREVGDLVVDNFGPSIWPGTEKHIGCDGIDFLEMMLLKDKGSLFTYKGKITKGGKYII